MRSIVLALPLALLLPVGMARAQAPGSYQQSCTDISQNGSTLSARCRTPNGQYTSTAIDLGRCRGQPVANSGGRLSCGGVRGSANPAGGDRFGDEGRPRQRRFDRGFGDDQQGYGGPPPGYGAPGAPRYGAPPPPPGYGPGDDQDAYAPPPRRRPRYDPDQDY